MRDTILDIALDYLARSKTKIDQSFLNAQFNTKGYKIWAGRDRAKHGGRLTEFEPNGFISGRLKGYETQQSECICLEFSFANRKWISLNICKPYNPNNMITFFDEITTNLS